MSTPKSTSMHQHNQHDQQPPNAPKRISAIILFEFICVAIIVGAMCYNTYGPSKIIRKIVEVESRMSTIEEEQRKMDSFFGILRSGRAESMTNQEILDEVNSKEANSNEVNNNEEYH